MKVLSVTYPKYSFLRWIPIETSRITMVPTITSKYTSSEPSISEPWIAGRRVRQGVQLPISSNETHVDEEAFVQGLPVITVIMPGSVIEPWSVISSSISVVKDFTQDGAKICRHFRTT